MEIVEATRRYEAWLGRCIKVVRADVSYKHKQMRSDPFLFFRATYYRWAQLWREHCPDLARAPEVFAIGDLHLENFGTWRDAEGRLVWGVNDFDEAYPLAFTNDLVRLTVSALLAARTSPHFKLHPDEIAARIAEGYHEAITQGGSPFVLMEQHPTLRRMATQDLRQPVTFWDRLETKTVPLKGSVPGTVRKAMLRLLPQGAEPEFRLLKHPKGLGSLGRRRFLAFIDWKGGRMAREAKSVVPSASLWARGGKPGEGNRWIERTLHSALRCADPYYEVRGDWLLRRIGPDCSRINIDELVHHENLASLLYSMGQETANIHLGAPKARKRIRAAWADLPKDWLADAAARMLKLSLKDWRQFKLAA